MSFWEFENLRRAVGGVWVARPGPAAQITGVSTDTRTLQRGQVFVALAGEHFDGHRMIGEAATKGSPLAIIDNPGAAGTPPAGMGVIRVQDSTRRALARLASAYRQTLDKTRVIAVVGSNGKTTTVRLIDAVLSSTMKGAASLKSFNNEIGVPLTILAARPDDGYLICEVGTNSPGEIAQLAKIVAPDVAVIVSIGREHLEKLGSLEGVAREEAGILEFVRRGGAGIYNADAPHLVEVIASLPSRPATMLGFGAGPRADLRIEDVHQDWRGVSFTLSDHTTFRLGLLGRHNALNAAAAVAVGRRLSVPDTEIGTGLALARGPEMRLERIEIGGVRVLNDAYNANPDSMRAGLEALAELGAGAARRVAVLGDMLELGPHTEPEHRDIGALLSGRKDPEWIVLVGESMRAAAKALPQERVLWIPEMDDEHGAGAAASLREGDTVLLKGSRRMRLERLVPAIRARFGARTACV
jgi:UDP-N-acetylmuramoyl-tripeptide--D-alanyl-D-alanine ligase